MPGVYLRSNQSVKLKFWPCPSESLIHLKSQVALYFIIHGKLISLLYVSRFDLLMIHKEELGQLMTLEQGKPLKEAIGEVTYLNFFSALSFLYSIN